MAPVRFGKLPPRYSFLLNPYPDERLTKCPNCGKLTYLRKFALTIHIEGWGIMVLGKTCRYCSRCEMIIAHQDELEAELAYAFGRIAPQAVRNDYTVLGTMEKKVWQQGCHGKGEALDESLRHIAEFSKVLTLEVEPGGRYPANEEPGD